jgi:8-oxo-dGTP pyrophosphatase MutT (NUDIX family)
MDLYCADLSERTPKATLLRAAEECRGAAAHSVKVPEAQSYGGVLLSEDGKVLLREPIDHLDGYVWTWPKGRPEKGENPAQTALREVYEETGYRACIIGVLPKLYIGTTRTNVFFLMKPVGEQEPIVNETSKTRWVRYEEACRLIEHNQHAMGRNRDRAILDDAVLYGSAATFRGPLVAAHSDPKTAVGHRDTTIVCRPGVNKFTKLSPLEWVRASFSVVL